MRLGAYILLLFSICVVFYWMGYTSPMMNLYSAQGNSSIIIACNQQQLCGTSGNVTCSDFETCKSNALMNKMVSSITSQDTINLLLGITIAGVLATFLGGFGSMFLIPMILVLAFLNFVVYPISFLFTSSMPPEIGIPLVVFFNILTVMAIVNFVRGGI